MKIGAFAASAGVALLLPLAGCGGGRAAKPANDDARGAYLRVAQDAQETAFTIDRATERLPDRPPELAREFRSLQKGVGYETTLLRPISGAAAAAGAAFALRRSLLVFEAALQRVAEQAFGGHRSPERALQGVRRAGTEVRTTAAALERALEARPEQPLVVEHPGIG